MHSPWLVAWIVVASLAGFQFAIVTWGMWESRRFARARLRKKLEADREQRVALFAPCKGLDVGIEGNLRALFEQDYTNYRLTFVVENGNDAVCPYLRRLIAEYPKVEAELRVADVATDSGQKVHNLWVATGELSSDIEVLAFVDSDARPHRDWLRRLVARLPHANVGAVTGYRLMIPSRAVTPQCLLYSINTTAASGFGPGGHHLVWGGSWAIRRELFDTLQIRAAWKGTLSDDFVATRVLHSAGRRVDFEPACMVISPVDGGWRQTLGFIRRQYVIARSYAPAWWLLLFVGTTLPALTFWGGLAILGVGIWQGAEWTWLPAAICPAYYAANLLRGWQRWQLARLYVPEPTPLMRRILWLDIWTGPLVTLVNWLTILSSVAGSRLNWRGIGYRLGRGGRVLSIERSDAVTQRMGAEGHLLPEGLSRPSRKRKSRVRV